MLYVDIMHLLNYTSSYNFACTRDPPSSAIVAPLTNAPALLLRKRHAPATSSGVPIRLSGMLDSITSLNFSSVAAIILLSNGPQASVLLVMFLFPRWFASTRLRWCRPAFEAVCRC